MAGKRRAYAHPSCGPHVYRLHVTISTSACPVPGRPADPRRGVVRTKNGHFVGHPSYRAIHFDVRVFGWRRHFVALHVGARQAAFGGRPGSVGWNVWWFRGPAIRLPLDRAGCGAVTEKTLVAGHANNDVVAGVNGALHLLRWGVMSDVALLASLFGAVFRGCATCDGGCGGGSDFGACFFRRWFRVANGWRFARNNVRWWAVKTFPRMNFVKSSLVQWWFGDIASVQRSKWRPSRRRLRKNCLSSRNVVLHAHKLQVVAFLLIRAFRSDRSKRRMQQ